ncbi:MAG: pirin family protein [Candidatus Lambdaproteobacteria bacterium]|nr:pirin family protein [Candidatus Lambdaproteobacteria bacterium]
MSSEAVLGVKPLGFPWETPDPFLTCVHHDDAYPRGNERLGPAASLAGRKLGTDFEGVDGWRMYHGEEVPGFPRHPHRGFETVTIARRGFIDHSDSLGATARFGRGDVQWMTAGRGIVHAEMFPLLDRDAPNPLELFQIWINLPAADKLVEPHFKMLWSQDIPTVTARDPEGRETRVTVVAGRLGGVRAPAPPPRSWAARPESDVAIWPIAMAPGARWVLPAAAPGTTRTAYVHRGEALTLGGRTIEGHAAVRLRPDADVALDNGGAPCEVLLLQGRPIGEPIAQYGPFVMNSRAEILQAFADYRQTEFGGWPWPSDGPVHPAAAGRHARHPDGRIERRG